MLFSSLTFLFAYLPLVLAVYHLLPFAARNWFLLAANLLFYGWGEPVYIWIMVASILIDYTHGWLIDKYRSNDRLARWFVAESVIMNLGLLFFFKYWDFFAGYLGLRQFGLPLPLGISFFTFQAMSYVIDVYRGVSSPQRNPLDVALYVTLFPQLVAGPIVRYETVAEEIRGRRENWADFSEGACRFAEGFAKKMLLANPLGVVADSAFDGADWIPAIAGGGPTSASMAWLGAVAFALQIYFDFSGYSDMAIGMGRMFGFHFRENFLHPYASRSVSEFWRRWHVSMGTWFRDYVYFPLGGSRVRTRARLVLNLLAVWFLTGLWHGADWTFVCWGLMYFALITAEKILGFRPEGHGLIRETLGRLYAGFFVLCGWVLFRADSFAAAGRYLGAMFGRGVPALHDPAFLLLLRENAPLLAAAVLLSLPVAPALESLADRLCETPGRAAARAVLRAAWLSLLFAASLSFVAKGAHNPFLYFNF